MDYTQMHYVLKHIEDTSITDDTKIKVLEELSSPKIKTSNFLTKDDFRTGMNWLLRYMQFREVSDALKYTAIEKRLKHLISSPYIRSFDQVNPVTHKYMRDIKDAGSISADALDSITAMIPSVCNTITEIIERPDFIDAVVKMIMENPERFKKVGDPDVN